MDTCEQRVFKFSHIVITRLGTRTLVGSLTLANGFHLTVNFHYVVHFHLVHLRQCL